MKFLQFGLIACLISLLPQKSDAFVYGSDEKMFFYSETDFQDNSGRELALCVLRKRYHVMWIAVWSNYSYAVAGNKCDTDTLYEYTEAQIRQDIASGELTAISSPEVPLNFSRFFWGYTWLLVAIPFVLLGLWGIRDHKKRTAKRAELTAHIPQQVRGPLAFLLQAALSDGTADDVELAAISAALKDVYSQRLSVAQLREIVDNTDMDFSAAEIETFVQTASNDDKHQALRLLIMVVMSDGNLDETEMKFAVEAGAKLGFTQDDVAQAYQAMSAPAAPEA